jgi:hypothetical protein
VIKSREALALLVDRLKAGAPKSASREARTAFATAVSCHLATAYPVAWRARHAIALNEAFEQRIQTLQEALKKLQAEIRRDPVGANALGLSADILRARAEPLETYLARASRRVRFELAPLEKEKRGRNNRAETVIAAMIAQEYRSHFGRLPGRSKQTDANNPFAAACVTVADYLTSIGRPMQIGPAARKTGRDTAARLTGEIKPKT